MGCYPTCAGVCWHMLRGAMRVSDEKLIEKILRTGV